jgi:predicted nuclease with RNAse H fold
VTFSGRLKNYDLVMETVAGVDVGGPKKGFHAVALRGTLVLDKVSSLDPATIANWCRKHQAKNIAIDAPCGLSRDGRSRVAERQLMAKKVWCFSTPTRAAAISHPKNQFGWMLAGAALYAAISSTHKLFDGNWDSKHPYSVETFPHAVACALSGGLVSEKNKGAIRRKLLRSLGIDDSRLPNIDFVDATLCAIVAGRLLVNDIEVLGSSIDGLIVVPRRLPEL